MILTPIEFFAGAHNLLGLRGPAKNLNGRQKRAFRPKWGFAIPSIGIDLNRRMIMKKYGVWILSIFTCVIGGEIRADGFSAEDTALLAGKDVFPGDDDESVLPQTDMADDQSGKENKF